MSAPELPAFDPFDVPEGNGSQLPESFRARTATRWYRRLGAVAGLTRFGVNLVRIAPAGQSSFRHAHLTQDEFVWVLEGETVMVTDAGRQVLGPGTCAAFPAGTGDAHHFLNEGTEDVLLLVVGDRTANDIVTYPDDDLEGRADADGRYVFTRKDGSSY